jgi:hypothetical protein
MTVTLGERREALDIIDGWIRENESEIAAAEGALPDFLVQLLDEAEGAFKTKAARVARYILTLDGEARQLADEIDRLRLRQKVRQNAATRLRRYLFDHMRLQNIADASDPFITVKLQKTPPKVTDAGLLTPDDLQDMYERAVIEGDALRQFVRCTPAVYELDKRAVLAAFKDGDPLPAGIGVVQDDTLRIR